MNCQARVCDVMSQKTGLQKFLSKGVTKIFAYPQNDVRDVARIMNDINIDYMPVLFSPWNKKLVGFIEYQKISAFLND